MNVIEAVNWNKRDDEFTEQFLKQNISQFWTEDEISVSRDISTWVELSEAEREAYRNVLGGLTLLDTQQGSEGMPLILLHVASLQQKSVLSFMGMMEQIHAKSYSHIFTTLCSNEQIDDIFNWIRGNQQLQTKASKISQYYRSLLKEDVSDRELYMAMVASVFLESFLFYSGFFYPLYLAGQGKLTASGEIISLIIRDEAIHGLYVGTIAQDIFARLGAEEQREVDEEVHRFLTELYDNEYRYTQEIYSSIGLVDDVAAYIRYNANKAMMNLGREPVFPEEEVNPIVLNGLKTDTKNHDFFSVKGNGYVMALNVEPLRDEDFVF